MGILHYAKANLRKNKSNSISLALLVLIISMLMSIGLTFITQIGSAYDRKADELNSAHVLYGVSKNDYKPDYETYFENDIRIVSYNRESAVYMPECKINYGSLVEIGVLLQNKDASRTISTFKLVEEDKSIPVEKAVYLPYYAKLTGYDTGDEYVIKYRNRPYGFIIAGFFEATEFTRVNNALRLFLPEAAFTYMRDQIGETVLLTGTLTDETQAEDFIDNFEKANKIDPESFFSATRIYGGYLTFKLTQIMSAFVFAGILVGFAIVAIVISLVVINFRVKNSIEDRMRDIGTLGSTGYTSGQIVGAFILEYALVALPAALSGIIASALMMPVIHLLLLNMTGMFLKINLNIIVNLLAALSIAFVLILMVLLSSKRIKKLPPVVALRGGLATHSFRRNYFPLHKGLGNVHTRLGFKNIFSYRSLYLMIGFVLMGVSVIVSFVWVMFANFSLDQTAFIKMAGAEVADIAVTVSGHTDADILAAEIETMDDVRKTSHFDMTSFNVEGTIVMGYVSNDYSIMETFYAFEGSMPQFENEVAVPKLFAEKFGKGIGDLIRLKLSGIEQEYLISGFFSTANNGGNVAALTTEGFRRINPGYERQTINIYLKGDVTFDQFAAKLQDRFGIVNMAQIDPNEKYAAAKARAEEKISVYMEQYGIDSVEYAVIYNGEIILKGGSAAYQLEKVTDWRAYLDTQIGAYGNGSLMLLLFISVIGLFMITLILFMTIKAILLKRRIELGTLKAGGFRTKELVTQMTLSFLPAALIGSGLGSVLGALLANPVFLILFSAAGGVSVVDMTISPVAMVLICVLLTAATLGIAALSALRIKKITVYELLTE